MATLKIPVIPPTKVRGESVVKLVPAPPAETMSLLCDDDGFASDSSTSSLGTTIEEDADANVDVQCGAVVSDDEVSGYLQAQFEAKWRE